MHAKADTAEHIALRYIAMPMLLFTMPDYATLQRPRMLPLRRRGDATF